MPLLLISFERTEVLDDKKLAKVFLRLANMLEEAAGQVLALEERLRQVELVIAQNKPSFRQNTSTEPNPLTKPPLDLDIRSHVSTAIAASWLNRTPQTLRKWACYEDGPIRPVKINGRLAWSIVEIRKLLSS